MLALTYILPLVVFLPQSAAELNSCQKHAICVLEKCIPPPEDGDNSTKKITQGELINFMLLQTSFGCVYGPSCYEECMDCESCAYAMEQIRRIVLDKPTEGECHGLEECAQACFNDQVRSRNPWTCFGRRCAVHCVSRRHCPPCYITLKNIFTGFCYQHQFHFRFKTKCRSLFEDTAATMVEEQEKKELARKRKEKEKEKADKAVPPQTSSP